MFPHNGLVRVYLAIFESASTLHSVVKFIIVQTVTTLINPLVGPKSTCQSLITTHLLFYLSAQWYLEKKKNINLETETFQILMVAVPRFIFGHNVTPYLEIYTGSLVMIESACRSICVHVFLYCRSCIVCM